MKIFPKTVPDFHVRAYSIRKESMKVLRLILILWAVCGFEMKAISQDEIDISYYCLMRDAQEDALPQSSYKMLQISGDKSYFHNDYVHHDTYEKGFLDPMLVWKNVSQEGQLTFAGVIGSYGFYYREPIPAFDWEMIDRDSVVCDYPCKMARTTFRGRTWTVWYSYDIPCSDGPWKLCGLPGIILKATDAKGDFSFTAYKIAKGETSTFKELLEGRKKTTPSQYVKNLVFCKKDHDGFDKEMTGKESQSLFFDEMGRPISLYPSQTACLIEKY